MKRLVLDAARVLGAASLGVSLSVLLMACGSADTSKLRVRAAFDLNCAEDQLKLTELESGTAHHQGAGAQYGVEGCGKRATYVYSDRKTWIMNAADGTPVKSDGTPVKSDEAPAKSDEAPAKSDEAPAKSDEAPAKSDGAPSE